MGSSLAFLFLIYINEPLSQLCACLIDQQTLRFKIIFKYTPDELVRAFFNERLDPVFVLDLIKVRDRQLKIFFIFLFLLFIKTLEEIFVEEAELLLLSVRFQDLK